MMERPQTTSVLDQMRVRGLYEELFTDTARLAAELSGPQDLARLTTDFDNGDTSLRDVGGMNARHRKLILDLYREKSIRDMANDVPFLFSSPVANLHDRVVWGDQDQPVGHNFFFNATGFVNAGLPWARQFDELIRAYSGASLHDINKLDDEEGKDRLLAAITENPDPTFMASLGVYLAGRSLEGERYQYTKYGEVIERAKGQVYATTQRIAATTGLRIDMLERAAGQLQRTTFGSFDHLAAMVTSDNRDGTMGDYQTGSLRIEVLAAGSAQGARERTQEEANHIIAHELNHAASAQVDGSRIGLKMNGQGLEANEGMTEHLAQLAIGSPDIERLTDGRAHVSENAPYRAAVFAMLALHEQFKAGKNDHFAVLFNAYHGDVCGQAQLEQALDTFYRHAVAISGQLSR